MTKLKFKLSSMLLILSTCAISYVSAADSESGDVAIQRSPSRHHFNDDRSHSLSLLPLTLSPTAPHKKQKVLIIDNPLEEHELGQFMAPNCKEIYLHGVYVGYERDGVFLKKSNLKFSPETINPTVEVLSLKGCGLKDPDLEGISKLRPRVLVLDGNWLTDACVPYILKMEGLEVLSMSTTELGDAGLGQLVKMPSLRKLDVTHNKKITDEGEKFLSENPRLTVDARFTSITDKTPRDY